MQIAEQERIASPTFVLAWVVSFLQFLAFYALVTTMAVYAVRQFAASDAGAGLASSAFVIGATVSRMVTGHVVDRFGKRRVLVAALVAVALAAVFAVATVWVEQLGNLEGFAWIIGALLGGVFYYAVMRSQRASAS